eukprot:CAMPEP_0194484482 /NCGR_PEP_ID=MMETSP0253-20130528/5796_1 /TAXON_ID=2966 /ORGANISM="Noctiluca scintillans" /LENGTH=185 /DNA_ID=CAMNT_0039324297 /DNA_START=85 /DNA_END=642 /DNA_ORIENTATION=-
MHRMSMCVVRFLAAVGMVMVFTVVGGLGAALVLSAGGSPANTTGPTVVKYKKDHFAGNNMTMVDATCETADCPQGGGCYEGTEAYLAFCLIGKSPITNAIMKNPKYVSGSCSSRGFSVLQMMPGGSAPDSCYGTLRLVSFYSSNEDWFWSKMAEVDVESARDCGAYQDANPTCSQLVIDEMAEDV